MGASKQRLVLLAALASAACGEARLAVQLVEMDGDHPFDLVARLEAVVIAGDVVVERANATVAPDEGGALALDPVARDDELRLLVTGYGADESVTAAGAATPQIPARDGSCCVRVCFCTMALYDNGLCTCGSDSCDECR